MKASENHYSKISFYVSCHFDEWSEEKSFTALGKDFSLALEMTSTRFFPDDLLEFHYKYLRLPVAKVSFPAGTTEDHAQANNNKHDGP